MRAETVFAQEGMLDYVKHFNAQGGINSVKVAMPWEDFRSLAPNGVVCYEKLKRAGALLHLSPLDTEIMVVLRRLVKDEIPFIYYPGSTSHVLVTDPLWVLGSGPEFENLITGAMKWAKEMWTEKRPLRVGYFHADEPILNMGWQAVVPFLIEMGLEPVGDEKLPLAGVIDSSVEWLRLASKKPDWIIASHYGSTMVVVIKDAARLSIQERGINLISDIATLSDQQVDAAGKAACEGWYRMAIEPLKTELDKSPGLKIVIEAAERYRGTKPEDLDLAYTRGWIISAVAVEAIRIAMEEAGFEDLTGRAIRDAFFMIKDFDTGLIPPITITEDMPFFNDHWYLSRIENGERVRVTDWEKIPRIGHLVLVDGEVHFKRF